MLSRKKIKLIKLMCPVAIGLFLGWTLLGRRVDMPEEFRSVPLLLFFAVVAVWFFLRKNWLRCPHCRGKLYDRLPGEDVDSFPCPHCRKEIIVQ